MPHYTLLSSLAGHFAEVTSLKFSPDEKWLASGADDGLIKIWDGNDGHFVKTLRGHSMGVTELCWSKDSFKIASSSKDETVRVWNLNNSNLLCDFQDFASEVLCCDFSVHSLVATGSHDGTISVWDARKRTRVTTFDAHALPVTSVNFNSEGTEMVSTSLDGYCKFWDTRVWECPKVLPYLGQRITSAEFSPDSRFLLKADLNDSIELWDVRRTARVAYYRGHQNSRYSVKPAFSMVARKVVCGSEDYDVYVWDLRNGVIAQQLKGHTGPVTVTACHRTGSNIASAAKGRDHTIKFWTRVAGDYD